MKKLILLVALITMVAFVSGAMAQPKPAPAKCGRPLLLHQRLRSLQRWKNLQGRFEWSMRQQRWLTLRRVRKR